MGFNMAATTFMFLFLFLCVVHGFVRGRWRYSSIDNEEIFSTNTLLTLEYLSELDGSVLPEHRIKWVLPWDCTEESPLTGHLVNFTCSHTGRHDVIAQRILGPNEDVEEDSIIIFASKSGCFNWFVRIKHSESLDPALSEHVELYIWIVDPREMSEMEINGTAAFPSPKSASLTNSFYNLGESPRITISPRIGLHVISAESVELSDSTFFIDAKYTRDQRLSYWYTKLGIRKISPLSSWSFIVRGKRVSLLGCAVNDLRPSVLTLPVFQFQKTEANQIQEILLKLPNEPMNISTVRIAASACAQHVRSAVIGPQLMLWTESQFQTSTLIDFSMQPHLFQQPPFSNQESIRDIALTAKHGYILTNQRLVKFYNKNARNGGAIAMSQVNLPIPADTVLGISSQSACDHLYDETTTDLTKRNDMIVMWTKTSVLIGESDKPIVETKLNQEFVESVLYALPLLSVKYILTLVSISDGEAFVLVGTGLESFSLSPPSFSTSLCLFLVCLFLLKDFFFQWLGYN